MIYISELAPETVKNAFCGAVFVKNNPALSGGIASHPDMHMCLFQRRHGEYFQDQGRYPASTRRALDLTPCALTGILYTI